jgi:uncharacterized protein DUF6459
MQAALAVRAASVGSVMVGSRTVGSRVTRPAVRIVPAPRMEPPADEEVAGWLPSPDEPVPWALPLAMAPTLPFELPVAGWARTGRAEPGRPAQSPERSGRPAARLVAHRFLCVCLEVLGGFRPVAHLRPFCAAEQFAGIAAHLCTPASSATLWWPPVGVRRRTRPSGPPAARSGRPGRVAKPGGEAKLGTAAAVTVRRVVTCEPRDGVTEVAAVLSQRDQVWAMAIRLERRGERWQCAYLRML